MAMVGIYKITNIETGIFYIGSSSNIKTRWRDHRNKLRRQTHDNQYLQSSWNKHGGNKFKFEVIELVPNINNLIEREQHWLDKTKCYKRGIGYNIAKYADSNLRRLSNKDIKNIAKLHKKGTHYKEIADKIDVSISTVHAIKNGHIYNGITGFKKVHYKPNKLAECDVRIIFRVCKSAEIRGLNFATVARQLSNYFNVSRDTVYDIKRGRSWGNITKIEHRVKHSDKTAEEIKSLYKDLKDGLSQEAIYAKYNVDKRYVNRIQRGEIWSNVTGIEYKNIYLSKDQVIEIYKRSHNGETMPMLAKEFEVSLTTIKRIKYRKTWREVTEGINLNQPIQLSFL